jgi:ATPase subunit of ABC transporter with duplicated ATPase domains
MKGWGINNRVLFRRAMAMQHRMERIRKTERPKTEKTMKARFGEKEFFGDSVFSVKGMEKSFGEKKLFSNVELLVEGGERIAILGDNGTGKTTFLRCLLGEEPVDAGRIRFGPTVKLAYLPQIMHFEHPERTLYDTMLYEKNCTPQQARDRLGAFLFSGEDVFKTVGTLSGGEQSRLRLCMLMDEKINLLILDEPTNHLDIASREWVECAIEEYEGTLIFVSHDRYFVDKFATRIWELEDGTIKDYPCGYAKYRSLKENAAIRPIPQTEKTDSKALEKEVRRLEREIDKQEQSLAALDEQLLAAASDYKELLRLTEEKEAAETALADLMAQWEQSAAALEAAP